MYYNVLYKQYLNVIIDDYQIATGYLLKIKKKLVLKWKKVIHGAIYVSVNCENE